ncbi:MAG: DUF1272 domain-containing protein [Thermoanaerobaculia bacterium]
MLELRPNCECCDCDLPPDSPRAMICTFECTFCVRCAVERFENRCPTCGGNLERRPIRPRELMDRYPALAARTALIRNCQPPG